jgi:hypothetical protein
VTYETNFWGARQTITGLWHEISVPRQCPTLYCGRFHGRRSETREHNTNLPLTGNSLDGVIQADAAIRLPLTTVGSASTDLAGSNFIR